MSKLIGFQAPDFPSVHVQIEYEDGPVQIIPCPTDLLEVWFKESIFSGQRVPCRIVEVCFFSKSFPASMPALSGELLREICNRIVAIAPAEYTADQVREAHRLHYFGGLADVPVQLGQYGEPVHLLTPNAGQE